MEVDVVVDVDIMWKLTLSSMWMPRLWQEHDVVSLPMDVSVKQEHIAVDAPECQEHDGIVDGVVDGSPMVQQHRASGSRP